MADSFVKLIYAEVAENSNKFWQAERDGAQVTYTWGRVGESGQSKTKAFGDATAAEKDLRKMEAQKLRRGYTRAQTVDGAKAQAPTNLGRIAREQIKHGNDPEVMRLIDFLVQRNVHAIEGATALRWNGREFTTPLGPVTAEAIAEAERLLGEISERLQQRDHHTDGFAKLVSRYMRIIPTNLGRKRLSVYDLFANDRDVRKQADLLEMLKTVLKDAEAAAKDETPEVFKTHLELVPTDHPDWRHVQDRFTRSINRGHQSAGMRLKRVFRVVIDGQKEAYEKDGAKLAHRMELWHGTKDSNLLSLLKGGFVIPGRGAGMHITGRMFGDGVYFSDQSTKSLNYATGFWGAGRSARAFMLLNGVAMGNSYVPRGPFSGKIPAGYDSCFAKAGVSGVRNNEAIVYRTSQVLTKFLCEFE